MSGVHITDKGKGHPIVLLHGFPLSGEIWKDLAEKLTLSYRVVTIDLPGFGQSKILPAGFSLKDVAQKINESLEQIDIDKCSLIGHSLGGYVALAMVKLRPELFTRLILFHSTPQADNEEKKESRNKVIEFVKKNGVQTFTGNFIPPLFADQNNSLVEKMKTIALRASEESVVGYTMAMRDRADMTELLRQFPTAVIAGEKDSVIKLDAVKKLQETIPSLTVEVLANAGHMGMVEKPIEAAAIIKNLIGNSNQP
jgi:pimeloyl-ACP methyl ester carboxylesterase